jgi:lysozyme
MTQNNLSEKDFLTKTEYYSSEKKQTKHRFFNTVMSLAVVGMLVYTLSNVLTPIYDRLSGLEDKRIEKEEISQLILDEGIRTCQYKDSLGYATIGVGHLVVEPDMPQCIDAHKAMQLLLKDYRYAKANVEKRYPWAEGEVKLILINLTFQLGENRLAKFTQTLKHLEQGEYISAAGEILDSQLYKQTPKRLERHVARIISLADINGAGK